MKISQLFSASLLWLALVYGLTAQENAPKSPAAPPEPQAMERQFDFWLGDWEVESKRAHALGVWRSEGQAKAEIRTALNGRVIVEQWTGQAALEARGFSLRTYDAQQARWEILSNWPSGKPGGFSMMVGNFDGPRGEFLPPVDEPQTRFEFSKIQPNSCQWEQSVIGANGRWKPDWMMNFVRTGPSASISAQEDSSNALPIAVPTRQVASELPEARQLDRLIGIWKGSAKRLGSDGNWETGIAQRRVTSMLDGWGLLQVTEYDWGEQSICALAYEPASGRWIEVGMSDSEPDCHWLAGVIIDSELRLNELATSDNAVHHVWSEMSTDAFVWTRESHPRGDGPGQPELVVEFQRSQPEGRIEGVPKVTPTVLSQLAQAQSLISQRKFREAEAPLNAVLSRQLGHPGANFLLGYVLQAQKKYPIAIDFYAIAERSPDPHIRTLAEYNLACIYSIQRNADAAIRHLRRAIQLGYNDFEQLEADADFDNIRGDPRFTALLPQERDDH